MRTLLKLAACAAALTAAVGCGEERGPGGLSSDEDRRLNEIAENLQAQDVVDTSPDSLTVNDEWSQAETGNAVTNSPASNEQ